ncbi:MAG: hypothetical protein GC137_01300 [Alphaproteobacteria bacterium]|nr:hypothetical protein [Alphaproteobacteria bacterium]
MKKTSDLIEKLSSPKLLHNILPFVMGYLIAGTIAQKYIGLYETTKIFFAAPVIWVSALPLPGFPVLLAIITLNISCKLIFKSPWRVQNAGIIITHIGVLVLLVGGLFTALFSSEGYIALGEGEKKAIVSDYHTREFVITDDENKTLHKINHRDLKSGDLKTFPDVPFSIKILDSCANCKITAREDATGNHIGMAQHMALVADKPEMQNEENFAGLTIEIDHDGKKEIHVLLEDIPQYPTIIGGENTYRLKLQRAQRKIPFSVRLLDFKKDVHPGTDVAKSYESRVLIEDGDLAWESTISMNAPLRYKGYTFFQSSFINSPEGEISVLAVVWNVGHAFPYISGLVLSFGLILHLFLRQRRGLA